MFPQGDSKMLKLLNKVNRIAVDSLSRDELENFRVEIFSTRDSAGMTILHYAVRRAFVEETELCINQINMPVNGTVDRAGNTPLHWALKLNGYSKDDEAIVSCLLDNGAFVNATNNALVTPLHYAVLKDNIHIIHGLIERGALVDALSISGTPLEWAIRAKCVDVINLLLQSNCDVNLKQAYMIHPLMSCIKAGLSSFIPSLVKKGANVNEPFSGITPLHFASLYGDVYAVTTLLQCGANANATDLVGLRAVNYAARANRLHTFPILIVATQPLFEPWAYDEIMRYHTGIEIQENLQHVIEDFKMRGKEAKKRKEYWTAIQYFTVAGIYSSFKASRKEVSYLYAKRGLCWAGLMEDEFALKDAEKGINLKRLSKAFYCKGVALQLKNEYMKAVDAFHLAWKQDPTKSNVAHAYRNAIDWAEAQFRIDHAPLPNF